MGWQNNILSDNPWSHRVPAKRNYHRPEFDTSRHISPLGCVGYDMRSEQRTNHWIPMVDQDRHLEEMVMVLLLCQFHWTSLDLPNTVQ